MFLRHVCWTRFLKTILDQDSGTQTCFFGTAETKKSPNLKTEPESHHTKPYRKHNHRNTTRRRTQVTHRFRLVFACLYSVFSCLFVGCKLPKSISPPGNCYQPWEWSKFACITQEKATWDHKPQTCWFRCQDLWKFPISRARGWQQMETRNGLKAGTIRPDWGLNFAAGLAERREHEDARKRKDIRIFFCGMPACKWPVISDTFCIGSVALVQYCHDLFNPQLRHTRDSLSRAS